MQSLVLNKRNDCVVTRVPKQILKTFMARSSHIQKLTHKIKRSKTHLNLRDVPGYYIGIISIECRMALDISAWPRVYRIQN